MRRSPVNHYKDALTTLAEGHAALIAQYELTISLLEAELHKESREENKRSKVDIDQGPAIRERTMTVLFRGRHCFLGNTIPLRLFQRLLQRRNQFIRHEELLDEVWCSIRSPSTIRSAIKVLRRQFRDAGMDELADAIDGRVAGHYGLMLDRAE